MFPRVACGSLMCFPLRPPVQNATLQPACPKVHHPASALTPSAGPSSFMCSHSHHLLRLGQAVQPVKHVCPPSSPTIAFLLGPMSLCSQTVLPPSTGVAVTFQSKGHEKASLTPCQKSGAPCWSNNHSQIHHKLRHPRQLWLVTPTPSQ